MTTSEPIQLLQLDPDLGSLLSDERREKAEQELVVRTDRLEVGVWNAGDLNGANSDYIGILLLDGVMARELVVADHVSAELLGPGDVIRPWQMKTELLPVEVLWSVMSPSWVAVLDRHFASDLAHWPEITTVLFERLAERSFRLATTQAISQLTRVDRRLVALFWHLAERWGRVSGDGVIVPLALTHRILGQLVGARRPTVSTALSELGERGELLRRSDGSWVLRGDPPSASVLQIQRELSRRAPYDLLRVQPEAGSTNGPNGQAGKKGGARAVAKQRSTRFRISK